MSFLKAVNKSYKVTAKISEKEIDSLVAELKKKFPKMWVKPGYEWEPNAILWSSAEEGTMPDGMPAFNYDGYDDDPKENIWTGGVHNELKKWAKEKNLFWEANDPGTYIAWEA